MSSLEAQVARLIITGFDGITVHPDHWLRKTPVGGVLLLPRNIESPAQLKELTTELRTLTSILAIDEEGGVVSRLESSKGFPPTFSQKTLHTAPTDQVQAHSRLIASQLADYGINLNLAPVVDIENQKNNFLSKRERLYSSDAAEVSTHARTVVKAHRAAGVRTALKHFPGHGSSLDDTHLGAADVTHTWSRSELLPFSSLIRSGHADCIMTAHIAHRGLDPDLPGTLSSKIVNGLLRSELGYQGPIISDDLQMGAIAAHFPVEEAAILALLAGVDLLLFANHENDPELPSQVISAIVAAVQSGRIPIETLQRASARLR